MKRTRKEEKELYQKTMKRYKTLKALSDKDQIKKLPSEQELIDSKKRIIGENNLLPIHFLLEGASIQGAVAKVLDPRAGTGFMVSASIFMTNNHVLSSRTNANIASLVFNHQRTHDGKKAGTEVFKLDSKLFHTNSKLDYTVVRVKPKSQIFAGVKWGFLSMAHDNFNYDPGERANIIQHPLGDFKKVAVQDNTILAEGEKSILYETDTELQSSGSPVLNNQWDLVALHHGKSDELLGGFFPNKGTKMTEIIKDLRERYRDEPDVLAELGI